MSILKNVSPFEENIREAFIPTTKKISDAEMSIKIKLNKSTKFFDKQQTEISGLEFKPGDKIVCILKTHGVVSDQNTSTQVWIGVQCLKFK